MKNSRFNAEEDVMKKRLVIVFVALAVMLAGAVSASAQLRLDIDINDPLYFGYSSAGVQQGVWNSYPYIPIPDAKLMYQFSLGPVNLGAGVASSASSSRTCCTLSSPPSWTSNRLSST